ncbi:unnamed protein product [Brugia timori]|uniref:Uncharacterized protein n=1 Tax=Brugia timori TaxID=42155 RepID=A0A0R3QUU5_9BILA|nr:unnamed protein product [Brugia timori]
MNRNDTKIIPKKERISDMKMNNPFCGWRHQSQSIVVEKKEAAWLTVGSPAIPTVSISKIETIKYVNVENDMRKKKKERWEKRID